jgi:hypothetical protein
MAFEYTERPPLQMPPPLNFIQTSNTRNKKGGGWQEKGHGCCKNAELS